MSTLTAELIGYAPVVLASLGSVALIVKDFRGYDRPVPRAFWTMAAAGVGSLIAAAGVYMAALLRWMQEGMLTPEQGVAIRATISGGVFLTALVYYLWRWGRK